MRLNKAVVHLKTIRYVGFISGLHVHFFFGHFFGWTFFVFLHFLFGVCRTSSQGLGLGLGLMQWAHYVCLCSCVLGYFWSLTLASRFFSFCYFRFECAFPRASLSLCCGRGRGLIWSWSWTWSWSWLWSWPWSLALLVVGLHGVLFLVWLVGLSSCPLGVGLSVDPWVLVSWSWPLVPGLSLGLLIFVLVMASWSWPWFWA